MSWKPEVLVNDKWCQNGLVFATEQEAADSASDLLSRWYVPTDSRAVEVDEPVNYSYLGRVLVPFLNTPYDPEGNAGTDGVQEEFRNDPYGMQEERRKHP